MPHDAHDSPRERIRSRLLVSGRVQGVGFRWFTHHAACARGLSGWVRNLADGRVEIEVEGGPVAVEDFVKTLRRGPPGARVHDLDRDVRRPEGEDGFEIRH